jgi:hypothetical protein
VASISSGPGPQAMLPGSMYDCFWPKIAAKLTRPWPALLFARRISYDA